MLLFFSPFFLFSPHVVSLPFFSSFPPTFFLPFSCLFLAFSLPFPHLFPTFLLPFSCLFPAFFLPFSYLFPTFFLPFSYLFPTLFLPFSYLFPTPFPTLFLPFSCLFPGSRGYRLCPTHAGASVALQYDQNGRWRQSRWSMFVLIMSIYPFNQLIIVSHQFINPFTP